MNDKHINRRNFLNILGGGALAVTAASCLRKSDGNDTPSSMASGDPAGGEMTYRVNPNTGDKVSILGFGCMRLPTLATESADGNNIDQEAVNRQVDYALAHGINYFDTSPAYCKGFSERAMGIALSRHPRDSYFIATKLSNFAPDTWSRKNSMAMYHNSMKELRVDYIDYLLLHGIGMGGMDSLNGRYIDNGILDFLVKEKESGKIRNLGFSYHGDVEVFDYLLKMQDEGRIHWDFVQIQLNYIDWKHAKEVNPRNTNAEYLYEELEKRGIPAVIMEPLLGGRLTQVNEHLAGKYKSLRPDDSIASWAFRFAGTPKGVLTVLSGMTYMEHLQDNLHTYSPLEPCTDEELVMLENAAREILHFPTVPCTDCKYCMPCPYGLDIPAIFSHYNKCINEGFVNEDTTDPAYRKARKAFLVGYDRSVPKLRQANHCIGCGQCKPHCPQAIDIPARMVAIDNYVESLKRNK